MSKQPRRAAPVARLSDLDLPPVDLSSGPAPGRQVSVAGVDVHVRHLEPATHAAAAEPVLLVHGLGGSTLDWTDFAQLLGTTLDVEMIDLPGFGRSGPAAGGNYSLGAQARTVIAYLQQSGRGPVHLVGNSMGGAISILVASQRPDLVRTLTLISPAVPDVRLRIHPLRHDPRLALVVVPGVGPMIMRRMGKIAVRARVKGTINVVFADPSRYPAQRLDELVAETELRADKPWVIAAMTGSTRGLVRNQFVHARSTWAAIRTITAPTLVLWGDTDRLVAPDLAGFVGAAIANARVLVLKNIGHTAMMEDPQTSARAFFGLVEDAAVVG
ncbi:MAG: alpha/beta hydrolase [Jatrophihabitantaceae bacterium]